MRTETGVLMSDWEEVGRAAVRAEAQGFDAVLTAEIAHDPFIPLAFAAVATERIGIGTGIAVAFPRSPMVIANSAWDLQARSGGRFSLGLGAQVKGHNERRFSVPWSAPVPRMREYVEALRAIWRCWEHDEPLHFEGDHYHFTLMTPEFYPKPTGLPPVPISIAAVGPAMLRLAGRVCDGVKLHGFATRKYLEEVAMPEIERGLTKSGRDRSTFEISGGGFIATGPDEEALRKSMEEIRYRVAFYGSTRSYRGVFAVHGWEDLGAELHDLSKRGKWSEMPALVSDEVLSTFAAVGTHDEIVDKIGQRFGGIADTVAFGFGSDTADGLASELLQDIRRIDTPFTGFALGGA